MKRKERVKYTEDDLLKAVADVKSGTSSYRQASRKYGVPIATLSDKIKLKVPLKAQQGKNILNIIYVLLNINSPVISETFLNYFNLETL